MGAATLVRWLPLLLRCRRLRCAPPPPSSHRLHGSLWINGCIGHGNYRCFLHMCCYLTAASLYAVGLLLSFNTRLLQLTMGWEEEAAAPGATAAAAGGAAAAAMGAAAGFATAAGATAAAAAGGLEQGPAATAGAAAVGVPLSVRLGWPAPFWLHASLQITATALALPVALGLVLLLVWNVFLCCQNKTTIEHHEGVFLSAVNAGGAHPYDLGWLANLHSLLGDRPLGWLLPLPPAAEGDGLRFPTRWDKAPTQAATGG